MSSIDTQYDLPEQEKVIKMGPSSLVILLCIKKTVFAKSEFLSTDILNENIPRKFSGNWLGYQLIWRYENQDSKNILSINILSRYLKYKEIFFFNKSS